MELKLKAKHGEHFKWSPNAWVAFRETPYYATYMF